MVLAFLPAACDTSPDGPEIEDPPFSTQRDIARIELTPTFVSLGSAESQELTAVAVYEDGESVDVTGIVEWVIPEEYADRIEVEEGVLLPIGVGQAQLYAALGPATSNLVTIEVGRFGFAVTSLQWDDTVHDPDDSVPQGNLVEVTVQVEGRLLDASRPDLIDLQIEGFVPFGLDRLEDGLDPYFQVVDDISYSGWFLVPPSAVTGPHAVSLVVEDIAGDGDESLQVASAILPPKTCDELATHSQTLDPFDERKYRVDLGMFPRAYRISAPADSSLDTALWLFDGDGELFTWSDSPYGGDLDAQLDIGISDRLRGTYYLVVTASPLAEDEDAETGEFQLTCTEEEVGGDTFQGSTGVVIPAGDGMVELDIEVDGIPVEPIVDQAWVHADITTDVPGLVSVFLRAPDSSLVVGLRAAGHEEEHAAVTWGIAIPPDDPTYDMTRFTDTDAEGTWTLELEDHSSSGNTVLNDWRLYLATREEDGGP